MFPTRRYLLAVLGVAALTPLALAQVPLRPSLGTPPGPNMEAPTSRQLSTYNTAPLGSGVANPYTHSPYAYPQYHAPAVAPVTSSPAVISASPYVLGGGFPGFGLGLAGAGPGVGYGAAMQGLASYTQAAGQYQGQIQDARMTREQVRQTQLDTKRQQVEYELWYEGVRPTAPKMIQAERRTDLDWARNDPPRTEIWSGKTFNVLYRSITGAVNPLGGPTIRIEPDILRGLNFNDGTTRGTLSLVKDTPKIEWTEVLQEKPFDDVRDRFVKSFNAALKIAEEGTTPSREVMGELRGDLKAVDDKLEDMVRDLSPDQYIESRRLLNQLNNTVRGLTNPRVVRASQQSWKKDINTVADLIGYMMRNGLQFGPTAAPGDEPSYTAFYFVLRSYERGLVGYSVSTGK